MSAIKNKMSSIINCFILLSPIVDLITSIGIHTFNINITFGIIIRMLFLLFILFSTTFIYKKNNIKYYLIFLIYLILYLIATMLYSNSYLSEIQGLFRVFYFPLLLVSINSIKDELKLNKKYLIYMLYLYLVLIFIPLLFHIGFKSYEVTKVGTLGFFSSANEIGGIISILTPILIYYLYEKKNLLLTIIISAIYLIVILSIGTKTPLLALLITLLAFVIYLIHGFIKNKEKNKLLITSIIIVLGIISIVLFVPKTNFYKNIKTHIDFLKIDEVSDVFDARIFDHLIFSERLKFLDNTKSIYDNSTALEHIVGIGYINESKLSKNVEMDYFDIFYNHGIMGFIIFFIPYIMILINIFKKKDKLFDFERYMSYISIFLIVILSLFTGHIITAPSVSIVIIYILISLL